jgi:hypothetical protein
MKKNITPEVCPSLSDERWNEYIKIADEEVGRMVRGGVPHYIERSELTSLANFTIVQHVSSGITGGALLRVAIQHRLLNLLRDERAWRKPLVPMPEDDGGDDDEWD